MIDEITLENFRDFGSLELKNLKPVNLIVGHNNSGKTSLLEALLLLCEPSRHAELFRLFRPVQGNEENRFYRWLLRDGAPGGKGGLRCRAGESENRLRLATHLDDLENEANSQGIRGTIVRRGQAVHLWAANNWKPQPCRIIPVNHRDPNSTVSLVGKAQRKSKGEETLQRLLAKVDPRIKKIRIDPGEDGNQLIVDIGLSELVPLAQVGQGVYRLITILADLIGESPAVLLIDEIENGLHHSVHEQVWTGLAETAAELNVQIFATTHSGECLQAAHNAFSKRESYDLGVIQLFRMAGGVQGRILDRKHMDAAIAGDIELR